MKDKIKELVGKRVEFFDKSGGVLQANLQYLINWWDADSIILFEAGKKHFQVKDIETGKQFKYRYNQVADVSGKEITFQ